MAQPIELKLFSESRLEPKPRGGLLTYNPNIELFAGAAGGKTLQIWRSNGQIVMKSTQRSERENVDAIRWRADGQFLAVAWSDGVVRLMGLETNKAVHQMKLCEPGNSKVTYIGWARNNVGNRPNTSPSVSTWQQLACQGLDPSSTKAAVDLPRELRFLEIETALPKISPLPASGGSGDDMFVFTTRASLESLFKPFSPEDSDKVDVMIVGTNDGCIHISIYDSFVIGTFNYNLPRSFNQLNPVQLHHHASHPDLSTHMLMFKPSTDGHTKELFIVPVDLTFLHSSPENLSLLASKTTTLQKLMRYTKQVQTHMMHEWQGTRDLPNRFLSSIDDTIREAGTYGEMNIEKALYHTVVTGHTFPEVQEWLVDQLAERGHKRWDKAVVSGLQTLRSLAHENFLPALERMSIILSRLLGIARFHEDREEIGFTSTQIQQVMSIVSSLILVGNKILLVVMEELELFHTFSIWLRHEIDTLASSSTTEELSEKEATMEHGKVLAYIQQYLSESPLRFYLSKSSAEESHQSQARIESGSSLIDMLSRQVKLHEAGQESPGTFPQIEFLCNYLDTKANAVFEGIAEAERRSVRFGQPTKIELEHTVTKFDVRMSAIRAADVIEGVNYTAVAAENENSNVYVFRSSTRVTNGISGPLKTEVSLLTFGDGRVLDLKFLYEDSLLVLWASKGRVPHRSEELGYVPYSAGIRTTPHVLSNEQVTSVFLNMSVPGDATFVPVQMETKAASWERGKLPPRVCLLGSDLQTYRVFALPDDPFKHAMEERQEDVPM
ncbi:anaphase-promoting complex, cyclosome, subunit 4-domain-containing protein [Xylariaceae sp. FL0016]|nr:anaphase-promoting complex, cyclosome, subunit 4-domain-containing protein [Xylariaceae sp. FL0016]